MKRRTRLLMIGCLHTTVYAILLPQFILPSFEGDNKTTARIITVALTIALTIAIVRIPKFLKKRADQQAAK